MGATLIIIQSMSLYPQRRERKRKKKTGARYQITSISCDHASSPAASIVFKWLNSMPSKSLSLFVYGTHTRTYGPIGFYQSRWSWVTVAERERRERERERERASAEPVTTWNASSILFFSLVLKAIRENKEKRDNHCLIVSNVTGNRNRVASRGQNRQWYRLSTSVCKI